MTLQVQTVSKRYTFYNVSWIEFDNNEFIIKFSDGKPQDSLKTKDIISILNRTEYD